MQLAQFIRVILVLAILEKVSFGSFGQGTFRNLNFEEADVPDIATGKTGGFVPVTVAIPGWTPYSVSGSSVTALNNVLHNDETIGSSSVALYGPEWPGFAILEGRYSVLLRSGPAISGFNVAIGQTGDIPISARSVIFRAADYQDGAFIGIQLSFAGNPLPLLRISSTPGYDVLGGDISAFAGQKGEMRFTTVSGGPITGYGGALLDDIAFSTQSVPEPSIIILLLAGLLFLFRPRKLSH